MRCIGHETIGLEDYFVAAQMTHFCWDLTAQISLHIALPLSSIAALPFVSSLCHIFEEAELSRVSRNLLISLPKMCAWFTPLHFAPGNSALPILKTDPVAGIQGAGRPLRARPENDDFPVVTIHVCTRWPGLAARPEPQAPAQIPVN
jgi:hypothetical protein